METRLELLFDSIAKKQQKMFSVKNVQPLVVLAEVTALLIKKESQQEFPFSSFQNQRQKLTTGAT